MSKSIGNTLHALKNGALMHLKEKSIDSGQSAQSAQADLNRNFLLDWSIFVNVKGITLTSEPLGSVTCYTNVTLRTYN